MRMLFGVEVREGTTTINLEKRDEMRSYDVFMHFGKK